MTEQLATSRLAYYKGTIIIEAKFFSINPGLKLLFVPRDSDTIWYTGDIFFDSNRVISANANCNLLQPACINRLYMLSLKTTEAFDRDDAFEFLVRLNGILKFRCNKCYAGFTDAYMNEILIEMGFNPIIKLSAVNAVWYNTFTFIVQLKYKNDQTIIKLTDYIFDEYLK